MTTKRVPREPTPEMVAAGGWVQAIDHVAIWRAMWDAAPDADAGRVAELEDTKKRVLQQNINMRAAMDKLELRIARAMAVLSNEDLTGDNACVQARAILRVNSDG